MTADSHKPQATQARNLVRAFELLNALSHAPGSTGLSDLARATGMPEATAHRLLNVLSELHVVRIRDDGRWQLGARCLELGAAYLESVEIRSEARELMVDLTEQSGETSALGVLDGHRVVYVEKIDSPHPVRMRSGVGLSNPAVSSSLGRALLAWSPEDTLEEILSHGLPARTSRTIDDADEFRAELHRIRERGYSVDDVENEWGIRGVGAVVFDHRAVAVAALSVAGPEQRFPASRLHELGPLVARAADELSARVGYSASRPVSTGRMGS